MIDSLLSTPESIRRDLTHGFEPPSRKSVSKSVEEFVWTHTPGGHSAMFKVPPYFRRPLDLISSRTYQGIVVVAPAQCLKTFTMIECVIAENIKNIHADMLVVQTRQDIARDFSMSRLARLLRWSIGTQELLIGDNVYDKQFKHGETVYLGWPAVSHFSGKTLQFVLMTDYDRFSQNIDGEGTAWQLAFNRIKAFLSRGKCVAESSPKGYSTDPKKALPTKHHYPPALGITSLYHQGTMEQWYWPCPLCGEYFQNRATFDEDYVYIPNCGDDLREAAEQSRIICPHCQGKVDIHKHKDAMNERGKWLAVGQTIDRNGVIHGDRPNTDMATFGLGGFAAQLQAPKTLVLKYLQAKKEYEESGDDTELMTVFNTQLGTVMRSMRVGTGELKEKLMQRAASSGLQKMVVPEWVRFLTARIDVQAGQIGKKRFVVQVHGHGVEEEIIIDRFNIRSTTSRVDEHGEEMPIEPGSYIEDWEEIERQVIDKVYPLESGDGYMPIKAVVCDQGGEDGVSDKAYEFYRYLKRKNKHHGFRLVKGGSNKNADIYKVSYPDNSKNKERKAGAWGDVPLILLHTDKCKDIVFNNLKREESGKGFIHFPPWLGAWFYDELTYEERGFDGRWIKPGKGNNEAFDLCAYGEGVTRLLNCHKSIFWENPPPWALEQDQNPEIVRIDNQSGDMCIAQPPKPRKPSRQRRVRYRR